MYDAITRRTYAELFKTAEAKTPERLRTALVKVASQHPAVRDALVASITPTPTRESKESR
jgi:hypothetical protein